MNKGFACFQANLRVCITIVVAVQCCLLLAYLEYSSSGSSLHQQPSVSPRQHITSYGLRQEYTLQTLGEDRERLHEKLPSNVIIPETYTSKSPKYHQFSLPLNTSYYARAIEKAKEHFKKGIKDAVRNVRIKAVRTNHTRSYVYRRSNRSSVLHQRKDKPFNKTGAQQRHTTGDIGQTSSRFDENHIVHDSHDANSLHNIDDQNSAPKVNLQFHSEKNPTNEDQRLSVMRSNITTMNQTRQAIKKDIHTIWQKDDLDLSRRPRVNRTSKGNLFRNYDLSNPALYYLTQDVDHSFRKDDQYHCYIEGTVTGVNATHLRGVQGCLCKRNWHGRYCSIPSSVFVSSSGQYVDSVTPRNTSRRIINALLFNMEYELLEARLHELYDVVDVFLIMESNYTNYGESKPLRLLKRLRAGYLREFHSKISYLFLDHFHPEGRADGWKAEAHSRTFIGVEGMKQIKNTRPDDLFIYSDADEIPSREALQFLKVHDGYSEPFGFTLRWSVYTFFWKQYEPTRLVMGCTLGVFKYVFQNHADRLRSAEESSFDMNILTPYTRTRALVYDWFIGDDINLAGWHCSWCVSPDRIRIKLTSAINADFPRWGDYPEKLRVDYIRNLVYTGTWFDDITKLNSLVDHLQDPDMAPKYMLDNFKKYDFLLSFDAIRSYADSLSTPVDSEHNNEGHPISDT